MTEFLQTYGSWIVLGVGFLLMMAMHSGHGAGHGRHTGSDMDGQSGAEAGGDAAPSTGAAQARRGGGCH